MKKISMLSFLFLAFFVAISAMVLKPGAALAASVCPLASAENRTIVNFFTATHGIITNCVGYCIRSDYASTDATFGPVSFSLAPGNYDVTLVSFDDHHDKPTNYQPNEIWKVILKNSSGTQLAVTNPISDLPDADDWRTEMVNSNLSITGSVFSATAFHANYKNLFDITPNSITPICAAFDLIPAPAINVVKSVNPTSLPYGGGNAVYSYAVTNPGNVALTNVVLTDDKCSPVNYINGDTNANTQLETTETWNYTCSKNITATTINTATVTGKYNTTNVSDTDTATVTVGSPPPVVCAGCGPVIIIVEEPRIAVTKIANPAVLSTVGGLVKYDYQVYNPGSNSSFLTNVILTDDKCSPVNYTGGDINNDTKLDRGEIWKYTCQTNLYTTTINTATATGNFKARVLTATAAATVIVPHTINNNLSIKVIKKATPEWIYSDGGQIVYSYDVLNPGVITLQNIILTDDKCSPVNYANGDVNGNSKLEPGEIWKYICNARLMTATTNITTVRGQADGRYVTDVTSATVVMIPKKLPDTGYEGLMSDMGWKLILPLLIFAGLALAVGDKKNIFKILRR